jgi:SAM-dependent methyltransferase
VPNVISFNRILDNKAREQYKEVINKLNDWLPGMMARKIPEANIQQAFVLDTVIKFSQKMKAPRILCVGSYDDTAAAGLKKLRIRIDEIDPVLNYDLNTFMGKPSTVKGGYDIIFSTSVLEHVEDDELFISQIAELLAPDGVAILTVDFNDQYNPADCIPQEDFRLYTQKDFKERLLPLLKDCSLVDAPEWDCSNPDFSYGGCHYTFATLVFRKKKV